MNPISAEPIHALCIESGGSSALGARLLGWRCAGYIEPDTAGAQTIARNIAAGVLDDAPVFVGSVDEFVSCGIAGDYSRVAGSLCVVWTGFTTANIADRVPQCERLCGTLHPRLMVVVGDTTPWLGDVLTRLASLGYDAEWDCIPAWVCGAPFTGEGRWLVAERQLVPPLESSTAAP